MYRTRPKNYLRLVQGKKLTLNLEKTEYIFFCARPIKVKPTLEIDNVTLRPVESVKFLGLWLDQNLNWNIHVNKPYY